MPFAARSRRFSGATTAPPPSATTQRCVGSASSAARSRRRNADSPSRAKISAIFMPLASSTLWSLSTNRQPSLDASARPTRLLPAPISPVKSTLRSRSPLPMRGEHSPSLDVGLRALHDARRHEHQELAPLVLRGLALEHGAEQRDVRQERHLGAARTRIHHVDPAEHHRLAVPQDGL